MGQFGPITLLPEREMTGTFTVKKVQKLNRPGHHCQPDDHYSFTDCLRSFVTRTSSCSIDILANKYNCTSEGLVKLLDTLNELKTMTKYDTSKTTGCLQKCTVLKYTYQYKNVEEATWRRDWLSSFYLSSRTTTYHTSEENYSYDEQVHISGSVLSPFLHYRILLGPSEATSACSWAGQ